MTRTLRLCLALLLSLLALSNGVRASGPAAVIIPDSSSIGITESTPAVVTVTVYDASDEPVSFPRVQWSAPATGPRVTFEAYEQGGEEFGQASVIVHAVGGRGTFPITASIAGATSATITVTTYADPLRIVSGSHQAAVINSGFAEPLIAQVQTLDGEPVAGASVTFRNELPGSATLSATSAITGPDGTAQITVTAGSIKGQFSVAIAAPGLDYGFQQVATFGMISAPVQSVTAFEGSGLELPIGGATRILKAHVRDINGSPVQYATVTFTAPAVGPGIGQFGCWFDCPLAVPNGGRVFTDNQGEAIAVVSANNEAGSYVVTASSEGALTVANFSLTNVARRAATILPNGNDQGDKHGEQTSLGGRFDRVRLRVIDADGAGLAGAVVTLTPPSSGPSMTLDQSVLVSDNDGWVETSGTANTTAGSFYLRADTPGVAGTFMYMQIAPPGFVIGDQIADLSAFDNAGTLRTLRSFGASGKYLFLDVCTVWCPNCNQQQAFGQTMKSQLAAMGVPIAVVPMLIDSQDIGEPSTQSNAATWFTRYRITDQVLHASGNPTAQIRQASEFLLGGYQGYPTFLLIAPDGTILDRHTGGFDSATAMKNFVLAKLPSDVSIAAVSVSESTASATLTVTRSSATGTASVNYTTAPGSASTADYSTRSGTLQFAAGQTSVTFTVPVVNDTIDEPNETFTVTLSNPVNTRIAQSQAVVTILDNDAPSAISALDARFSEGTGTTNTVSLPVRLDRGSAFAITVDYAVVAGTAKSTDVTLSKGTMKFEPGQIERSVPLILNADKLIETKETFTVHFSAPVNATLSTSDALVAIVDDDKDTATPIIDKHDDVIIEVKMDAKSLVVVDYKTPDAVDKIDGVIPVSCLVASGVKRGYGSEVVTCAAEDKAGNLATTKFNLIVRLPTVAGAIFDPKHPTVAMTEQRRGEDILVHVNAGAFARRGEVTLTFIDAKGRRHCLGTERAAKDGSLDAVVPLPRGTALGLGQVLADSDVSNGGEYDRAWFLTVTRRNTLPRKHRH